MKCFILSILYLSKTSRCKIPHIFWNDEWAQIEERMLPTAGCANATALHGLSMHPFRATIHSKIPIIIYFSSPLNSTLVHFKHA